MLPGFNYNTKHKCKEHEVVQDKIRNIIKNFDEFSECDELMNQPTSKHQLDSLFENFEHIASNSNNTLLDVHENLKKSKVRGIEILKDFEGDAESDGGTTMRLSKRAKDALQNSLSKIAEAVKNNKNMTASEMSALQEQMQKTFETVSYLEKDIEKHLIALGGKSKEFEKYRDHTNKKIAMLNEQFNHRLNELLVELRQAEIKYEEADSKIQKIEKAARREEGLSQRASSLHSSNNSSNNNNNNGGWDNNPSLMGSPESGRVSSSSLAKDCDGAENSSPKTSKQNRKLKDQVKQLSEHLSSKEKEILSLRTEVQAFHKKEMEMVAQSAMNKVHKELIEADTQTITTKGKDADKEYPLMKSDEDPMDYAEKFFEFHNHPDPTSVIAHFRKLKLSGDAKAKELAALTRESRILQKQLEDSAKTTQDAQRRMSQISKQVSVFHTGGGH